VAAAWQRAKAAAYSRRCISSIENHQHQQPRANNASISSNISSSCVWRCDTILVPRIYDSSLCSLLTRYNVAAISIIARMP